MNRLVLILCFGLSIVLVTGSPLAVAAESPYVVFVDAGEGDAYLAAAERLAKFHGAPIVPFEAPDLTPVAEAARSKQPRFAAFVLPPAKIDVDLAHDVLELAVRVDDDPFVDFEFGFITGRDGAAADAFVGRIIAAWGRNPGRDAGLFGSWEGRMAPMRTKLTAMAAMGFEAESAYVMIHDPEEKRAAASKAALEKLAKKDALIFFSHGYPDEMAGCFRAEDLRDWKIEMKASLLVNCACYNGAPGRWYAPGAAGPVDRGLVSAEDSVALQIIDSGVAAYVGGVDPWHGLLANMVFDLIAGEGMRVGEATKRMFDRLALDFYPERIEFPRTMEHRRRFSGEGTNNRRHNGAGMILYGDPAYAPFADQSPRAIAETTMPSSETEPWTIRVGTRPLVDGPAGEDFMIPMNVLLDYYSVKTAENFMQQLGIEIHRVVALPLGVTKAPRVTVRAVRMGIAEEAEGGSGGIKAPGSTAAVRGGEPTARAPQVVMESTPNGALLHVRVALEQPWFPPGNWPMRISQKGLTVELEARRDRD